MTRMRAHALVLVAAALAACAPCRAAAAAPYCALYGTCRPAGGDAFTPRSVNCANAPGAVPPAMPDFNLTACPEYQGAACCNEAQHAALRDNLGHAALLFGRCPACAEDFRRLWCAFTCSPQQGWFVNVTAVGYYDDTSPPRGVAVADVAQFDVAPPFGDALYSACEGVQFPATGQSVLHTFGWDKGFRYFLAQQGRVLPGGYSPFAIDFAFTPAGLDVAAAACDDAAGGWACAASDCAAAAGGAGECPLSPAASRGAAASRGTEAAAGAAGAALAACSALWAAWAARDAAADEADAKAAAAAAAAAAEEAEEAEALRSPAMQPSMPASLYSPLLPPTPYTPSRDDGDLPPGAAAAPGSRIWRAWGAAVGRRPALVLALSAGAAIAGVGTAAGLLRLDTDPARLWVPPHSAGAREAATSASLFGRFYRVAQVIATPRAGGPALTAAAVEELLALQQRVAALAVPMPGGGGVVTLDDVCFKPDKAAAGVAGCLVQSPSNWFGDDAAAVAQPPPLAEGVASTFDTWLRGGGGGAWAGCLADAAHPRCLSPAGLPAFPHVVLGGWDAAHDGDPGDATALVVTWLLRGVEDERDDAPARAFEAAMLLQLAAAADASPLLRLAYSAERSVADELRRETGMDTAAVGAAYLAMALYVAIALAPRGTRLGARIALAAGGMACVAGALGIAAGVAAACGVRASLIAAEVVPFLVLACGVDNMFVLADAWRRAAAAGAGAPAALVAAETAADVGAAVTAAAAAEVAALALGAAMAAMPAVRGFAALSCLAIGADYALQMGAFLALLTLYADPSPPLVPTAAEGEADLTRSIAAGSDGYATEPEAVAVSAPLQQQEGHPAVRAYAAALLRPRVCAAVLAVAGAAAGASLAAIPLMPLGLDQASALPPDSYLAPYFAAVADLLQVGPPVYWTLPAAVPYWTLRAQNALSSLPCAHAAADEEDTDAADSSGDGNATCPPSLATRLGACGRGDAAAAAHLSGGPNDWLGDYLRWLDPASALCRTASPNGSASGNAAVPAPCAAAGAAADVAGCGVCGAERGEDGATWQPRPADWLRLAPGGGGPPRPRRATFEAHLPLFLASRCSAAAQVSLCGTPYTTALDAAYTRWATATVAHAADPASGPHPGPSPGIAASRFAAFHAPLRTQSDFIGARGAAAALGGALAATMPSAVVPHSLFAYSPWYVFFEQYAGIRAAALAAGAAAAGCAFAAAAAALRSARAAAAVAAAVAGTVLCLAGASAAAGVSLNALSLVNLSAAAGIATEFCIHIAARAARAAAAGASPRDAAAAGLAAAGGVVARGVVATKAIGVACLALARTRVFRTYYFGMYAALVALAATHALAVMPALLATRAPRAWRRRGG